VTSPALLTELASVLAYPKLRSALTNAEAFVDRYHRTAHIVLPEHRSDALADEDDNRLVEAAEAARAEFIVTGVVRHADGMAVSEIIDALPDLEHQDVSEALHDAAEALRERELPLCFGA